MVVYPAAVVLEPVGDNQVFDAQDHVVAGNLVEDGLGNLYAGSLVFHNHQGRKVSAVQHGVASLPGAVQVDLNLVCEESLGVTFVSKQVVGEVLPDPFFGGQGDVFLRKVSKMYLFPSLLVILSGKLGKFNANILLNLQ